MHSHEAEDLKPQSPSDLLCYILYRQNVALRQSASDSPAEVHAVDFSDLDLALLIQNFWGLGQEVYTFLLSLAESYVASNIYI